MTEAKPTRTVRRGRIFPDIQWSPEKIARRQTERKARYQRCKVVFDKIQPELIETRYNWFVAIESNSGDYFIHKNAEVVRERLRKKHPDAIPVLFKINETGACGTI
ncbi:MAG TPA: hypothetical protein DCE56_03005 [Cyanobacteria bacterium UBA8553]|nr:hypothetical protein [Cyanobacteria bacterium UBA8553]HAJ60810.1 hypothetical protein [Cyanobacteria bacterium UBA8543]